MPTWMARLLGTGILFGVDVAQSQAGSLDTIFGKGGMVTAESCMSVIALAAIEQSKGDIAGMTASNKSGFSNLELLGSHRRLAQRRFQRADGAITPDLIREYAEPLFGGLPSETVPTSYSAMQVISLRELCSAVQTTAQVSGHPSIVTGIKTTRASYLLRT